MPNWPPSLTDFVSRCFVRYADRKDEIESAVKRIIQSRLEENSIESTDWQSMSVPELPPRAAAAGFAPMYVSATAATSLPHRDRSAAAPSPYSAQHAGYAPPSSWPAASYPPPPAFAPTPGYSSTAYSSYPAGQHVDAYGQSTAAAPHSTEWYATGFSQPHPTPLPSRVPPIPPPSAAPPTSQLYATPTPPYLNTSTTVPTPVESFTSPAFFMHPLRLQKHQQQQQSQPQPQSQPQSQPQPQPQPPQQQQYDSSRWAGNTTAASFVHPSRAGRVALSAAPPLSSVAPLPSSAAPLPSTSQHAPSAEADGRASTRPPRAGKTPPVGGTKKTADKTGKVQRKGKREPAAPSEEFTYFSLMSDAAKEKRQRLHNCSDASRPSGRRDVVAETDGPVVGRSTALEKAYLRLTDDVDPGTVRPLDVLRRSFEHVLNRWDRENDYVYLCEQLKSIRQDLVVQRIFDSFTVKVYETHARIALRNGDVAEFTQCQSQLRPLYDDHQLGHPDNVNEFLAYRLLFHMKTNTMLDLNIEIQSLSPAQRRIPVVAHAIDTCLAWSAVNYSAFFRLYRSAPNLGAILMDTFVPQFRLKAAAAMSRAYRDIDVDSLQQLLAFASREQLVEFVAAQNYTISAASGTVVFHSRD